MATQVRLFVSAAPAEDGARELLGRALAELPINVGWIIKRTPDIASVAECHLFAVVLGRDIVAPVGLELWWARRTEKPVVGYVAEGTRTPAGQVFVQDNLHLDWRTYGDLVALRRAFQLDMSRFLLAHSERYGVTVVDAEILRGFVSRLERSASVPSSQDQVHEGPLAKAQGAGGGGVILAPGKDTPRGARVIGGDKP